MATLRRLTVDLCVGDTILVGPNDKPATITKIEYFPRTGSISLNTTAGPRNALTFRLVEDGCAGENPADKYR